LRGFWNEWFGTIGRELGCPYREFVHSIPEFLDFIGCCELEGLPCYVAVQPYIDRDVVYGLEKVFFDFDSKADPPDLDRAWAEASDFADKLRFFYKVEPLFVFSGRKGYHVYVWLWSSVSFDPQQEGLAKEVYRTIQEKLLEGLKYSTLDAQVIGNIKGLSRLPYTTHEGSGLTCQPVDGEREPIDITSLEGYRANGIQEDVFSRIVGEVMARMELKGKKIPAGNRSYGGVRESVKAIIEAARGGQKLSHRQRLVILFELINKGYGDEAIQEVFSGQPDYSERKVQYMIGHARRRGYLPFRSENILREAMAVGRED